MKKKNYKSKSIILLLVWILLLIVIPFSVSKIESNLNKTSGAYLTSDFEIEEYNVVLDVDKDNKIDVTENITINIPDDNFNGIYKSIPLWQKYYTKNMKEYKKKIQISNLRAIGEKFVLDNTDSKIGIMIGSSRTNIEKGLHTYTIKYRYNMGKDLNKDFDNLIFNVFDSYNNTKINDLTVTVNMPEVFNSDEIMFLKEVEDITNHINYTIDGKSLTFNLNNYILDESLTINMTLKDGYFKGGTYNYGFKTLLICILTIIVSICSFLAWRKYGKDYSKRSQSVEFYPPENFDAAQIGFVYGEQSIKKLTVALIIGLASKGYVSIEEDENNKYKIINKGKETKSLKELSITEQLVYQELFINGDINTLYNDSEFTKVFPKISKCLESIIDKKVNDLGSNKITVIIFGALFASIILWTLSYLFIKDLNPQYELLYLISFISIFITGFFTIFMNRKTTYGEILIAKVLGFKNYLLTVEKEMLDSLVKKNPDYFYDILPYTYVLGISQKWISAFEKNNVPNIDIEALKYYEDNLFMIITE